MLTRRTTAEGRPEPVLQSRHFFGRLRKAEFGRLQAKKGSRRLRLHTLECVNLSPGSRLRPTKKIGFGSGTAGFSAAPERSRPGPLPVYIV